MSLLRRRFTSVVPLTVLLSCSQQPAGDGGPQEASGGQTIDSGGASSGGTSHAAVGGTGATGNGTGGAGSGGAPLVGTGCGTPTTATLAPPESAGISQAVFINHIGYDEESAKKATVEATGTLSKFQVIRVGDQSVAMEGSLSPHPDFNEWGGGPEYYVADFSCLDESGNFAVAVNGETSEPFVIGENRLFSETFRSILSYFEASRADDPQIWAADAEVPFFDGEATVDARGGWYDASGDVSKYLSHLSYANFMNPQQTPLVAWGLAWVFDEAASLFQGTSLPTQIQDEALWGADYLVRVLDEAGYFYINVFDGWSGDPQARRICAYSTDAGTMSTDWQAGYREGGGMAIAALARISRWNEEGNFSAAEYLAAAEDGFSHLEAQNTAYLDDGKENIIDDYTALLAALELFAATEDEKYRTAARLRADSLISRIHEEGYFIADGSQRPFWHASDAGLPIVALTRFVELETDNEKKTSATAAIKTHLDYLTTLTASISNPFGYARQHTNVGSIVQPTFFVPHDNESGYWWQGESARLGSLAAAALIGGRVAYPDSTEPMGVPSHLNAFATDQLDWITGKNPYDMSLMQGFGRNNPLPYCPELNLLNGEHDGGIVNGITGKNGDGTGIQWLSTEQECWTNWRWSEQWLPHAAWYMIASVAASL